MSTSFCAMAGSTFVKRRQNNVEVTLAMYHPIFNQFNVVTTFCVRSDDSLQRNRCLKILTYFSNICALRLTV